MKSFFFFLVLAALWEMGLYFAIRKLFGPPRLRQWAAHFLIRSALGLLGYALLIDRSIGYGAVALFHGSGLSWPATALVLIAFIAMISGAVFAMLTLPPVMVYSLFRAYKNRGAARFISQ